MTQAAARRWPGYNVIWRFHFYAGLFCIPFVLWLAATGSFYLFRPQVEAWLDQPYTKLELTGQRAAASDQARAAVAAVPGSVLHRYQVPEHPDDAAQVIVGTGERESRVYVHPQTLRILKVQDEDSRLMRVIFRLHGELLMGDRGSYIVELAASWAIVMILSGLFLWWPRGTGLAGVVYPRLRSGGRRFWRDLHGVTGFWVSFFALFLLVSGLPWSKSWGSNLKAVRAVVEGSPAAPQDWSAGRAAELAARARTDSGTRAMQGDHAEHGGMTMAHPASGLGPLDTVIPTVRPLGLAAPVLIAPPTAPGLPWTAKSDAANRPLRTNLEIDGSSGAVVDRKDFAQRRLIDRLVGYGVAIHEGQLFGVLNQLLNLATALGLMLLSVSSVILWWRRRPEGKLGAPIRQPRPALAIGFFVLIGLLGVLLPLLGASLLAVILIERTVLRATPRLRVWLGC